MEEKNYDTLRELAILKNEETQKENSLDIEKEAFKKKLLNGLGEDIMENLKHPKKPNFWVGVKYRFLRWNRDREFKRLLNKNGEH